VNQALARKVLLATVLGVLPVAVRAQAAEIEAGARAERAQHLDAARRSFEAALRIDSASYEANWRIALVLIDIAKQTPDRLKSPQRDSTYRLAESYARRAVAENPNDAEGHFALANAIGRASLSMSARAMVRRATEVRDEALRAVHLNPRHDGAWHILGRWNAEVERLPGLEKFFAKAFLGASVFGAASWDEAEHDLRLAVEYAPQKIVHHFDLAEILVSRKKWADALQQLDEVERLPVADVSDTSYKRQGRELAPSIAAHVK
jgi:tetratricopeptide (TPR) repeat protein